MQIKTLGTASKPTRLIEAKQLHSKPTRLIECMQNWQLHGARSNEKVTPHSEKNLSSVPTC